MHANLSPMQTPFKRRFNQGFTLIELLVVISIIGILAVALVPRIIEGPAKARDLTRKAHLSDITKALQVYFTDNNTYPGSMGTYECISVSGTSNTVIAPLMKGSVVPTDPTTNRVKPCSSPPGGYGYLPISATSYVVAALAETTTATGPGFYCGLDLSNATFDVTTDLAPCTAADNGNEHFYALYQ